MIPPIPIALVTLLAGCSKVQRTQVVSVDDTVDIEAIVSRYTEHALAPARLPPPSVDPGPLEAAAPGLSATATLVRAEDADWNRWPGPTSRLFNNRAALLFELHLEADEPQQPVRWLPTATSLEVNHEGHALGAAVTADMLLEELVVLAYQQERALLPGDLAARSRGAGGLRAAYLAVEPTHGSAAGLIAFPLDGQTATRHIVAMRLNVAVQVGEQTRWLSWLFH